jgi:hypothetical protein
MGDLPRWKIKSSFIVMGDLPTWKMQRWSHCNGWTTKVKNGLIVMSDLPRWKITWRKDLAKEVLTGWLDRAGKLGVSWLQRWPEDSSWWQCWSSHFFEIFLMVEFISCSSRSRVKAMILSVHNLAGLHWGFSYNKSKIYVQCFEVRWHACILTWFEI